MLGAMQEKAPVGYPCPSCGTPSLVYSTKQQASTEGWATKRYRRCDKCGKRFTTLELLVIKDADD